jgi:hypothetical protein
LKSLICDNIFRKIKEYSRRIDAARDTLASLQLLKDRLEDKHEEIGPAFALGWYTFNSRLGEPTHTRLAADGTEVICKPSDCTWYAYYPYSIAQYTLSAVTTAVPSRLPNT